MEHSQAERLRQGGPGAAGCPRRPAATPPCICRRRSGPRHCVRRSGGRQPKPFRFEHWRTLLKKGLRKVAKWSRQDYASFVAGFYGPVPGSVTGMVKKLSQCTQLAVAFQGSEMTQRPAAWLLCELMRRPIIARVDDKRWALADPTKLLVGRRR